MRPVCAGTLARRACDRRSGLLPCRPGWPGCLLRLGPQERLGTKSGMSESGTSGRLPEAGVPLPRVRATCEYALEAIWWEGHGRVRHSDVGAQDFGPSQARRAR